MEEFTYGDDGIPVIVDDTSNPSSPAHRPPKPRARPKKDGFIQSVKKELSDNSDEDEGETSTGDKIPTAVDLEEESKAVFTIDGEGFDVVLSLKSGKIYWSPMNALGRRKKSGRKLSGIFRGRRPSLNADATTDGFPLTNLIGASVRKRPKPGDKEENGICLGIVLSFRENKDENTLRERTVFLEHPSDDLCSAWVLKILNYIHNTQRRTRNIKLFLQPYAGNKTGRNFYQRTILPLFKTAAVKVDRVELLHNEHAKQEMIHTNLEDYDCIVVMGGDGTVSRVVDALMNRSQKEGGVDMKHSTQPARCPVPLGIIPTGRTNYVAQSVMGVADPINATIHIIYGNCHPVDVCSIYTPDKFLQWGFNSQYGFAGQILTYMKRYKALGSKRVNAAFLKALTKAKLRAYECDIEYIPADPIPKDKIIPCRTGCSVCWSAEGPGQQDTVCDLVEDFDPLNESFTSNASSVIDLPQDRPWRNLKGKYMNVGIFAMSGMSDVAPQGMNKCTHLNDGVMDLVLVKEVERKEFARFLRRFGNSKDQHAFPFIETYRVKEVRFRPRFPMSWNYNDHDYNEIKYQMERESRVKSTKSVEVIADLERDARCSRAESVETLDISDDDDDQDDGDKEKDDQGEPRPRLVGPQYRKTFTEIEIAKRRESQRKKEEKMKAREEAKSMSLWNIENQMRTNIELDFRVHHGLLQICGLGVSPLTDFDDIRHGCLSGM